MENVNHVQSGKYSLEYPVNIQTKCDDGSKTPGIVSCYSDIIKVDVGYWRRFPQNKAILRCSLNLNGCQGGDTTGNGLCKLGYQGLLCSTCSEGYYIDNTICSSCKKKKTQSKNTIFTICFAGLIIMIISIYLYYKYVYHYDIIHYLEQISHQFIIRFKIMISTYRVVSTIPTSLSIQFPDNVTLFLNSINIVNVNIMAIIPIGCNFHFDFIYKLVITTVAPIIAIMFLIICYLIQRIFIMYRLQQHHHRHHVVSVDNNNVNSSCNNNYNNDDDNTNDDNTTSADDEFKSELNRIKNQYLNYFLYLSCLLLQQ